MFSVFKEILSQTISIFKSQVMDKTSFLKRKIYGDYESLSSLKYWLMVAGTIVVNVILIIFIYINIMTLSNDIKAWISYVWIVLLLLVLIFFITITYDLLFYSHLYRRDRFPICYYLDVNDSNSRKKAIIIDMFKGYALVEDITNDNKSKLKSMYLKCDDMGPLKLVNLDKLDGITIKGSNNGYKKKIKDLRKKVSSLKKQLNNCKKNCKEHKRSDSNESGSESN